MNSKIATLLSRSINNTKIVPEMINYICDRDCGIEDHLVDLCLGADEIFVTKDNVLKHIDKIQSLCIKSRENIENVSNIKVIAINNIARNITIVFTAEVTAWFKNQDSADKRYAWCSTNKEDDEHHIKGTCITEYPMCISFKDIDIY